jgi:hypothetical protein
MIINVIKLMIFITLSPYKFYNIPYNSKSRRGRAIILQSALDFSKSIMFLNY